MPTVKSPRAPNKIPKRFPRNMGHLTEISSRGTNARLLPNITRELTISIWGDNSCNMLESRKLRIFQASAAPAAPEVSVSITPRSPSVCLNLRLRYGQRGSGAQRSGPRQRAGFLQSRSLSARKQYKYVDLSLKRPTFA